MPRCPACRNWFRGEREEVGARCPLCRQPLYERPERFKPEAPETDNYCTVHARNPARGACHRCGNFQCDLCRTRYRDRWLCVACVSRALEANDVRPEEVRAHWWLSSLALTLGIAGWGILLFSLIVAAAGLTDVRMIIVVGLLIIVSIVPSVIGVGFGAAALRGRGNHMILATIGLLLSGLHVGAFLGLMSFALWNAVV